MRTLHKAAATWGYPRRFLSDNGRIFTTPPGSGLGAMEAELLALGIETRHSRPYHPQTCGKIERFHQTLRSSGQAGPATTKKLLQGQLDRFVEYYNTSDRTRSRAAHTARGLRCREKAGPVGPRIEAAGYRIRHDKVDTSGSVTLRYKGNCTTSAWVSYAGWRVILLVDGLDADLGIDGSPLRHLTLDPSVDYSGSPEDGMRMQALRCVETSLSMSENNAAPTGFEPVSPP